MTETLLDPPDVVPPPRPTRDDVREALMESRQRWRHLVNLAADLVFETDAEGRFTLLLPEDALGWPPGSLIGQTSEGLVGEQGTDAVFNPFHPPMEIKRHNAWLRRADGRWILMAFSATPLVNRTGQAVGARGIGIDITDEDMASSQISSRLRRQHALHHLLSSVGRASDTDSKMDAALWALIHAVGAEGAAVIGAVSNDARVEVLHECGPGASAVLDAAARLVAGHTGEPGHITNCDARLVMAVPCATRFDARSALAIWRKPGSRIWDDEDTALIGAAVDVVRMILEYEALQREMAHRARTDPLTDLLNRRAFVEEMERHIARLDRESEPGTLMFVDLDAFKTVNDRLGHAAGDQILVKMADMLRELVRPFDLIARFGGDEFAVWLSGTDHMTAAERADHLCRTAPDELQAMLPEAFPKLGVSVGIATRRAGSQEPIEALLKRADLTMFEVKRSGRRHWRVSLLDGDR